MSTNRTPGYPASVAIEDARSAQREHLALAARVAGIELGEVALPTEHDVQVNGLRLHYVDWGAANGMPLLFLHGGGLTCRTWDLLCLSLRERYQCLALDLRGHGDSEWAADGDYDVDAIAADVFALSG